jgi:hypothetical protein
LSKTLKTSLGNGTTTSSSRAAGNFERSIWRGGASANATLEAQVRAQETKTEYLFIILTPLQAPLSRSCLAKDQDPPLNKELA